MSVEGGGMEWPDIVIIVLYFVLVLGVGFWATCRANTTTSAGYFLAGRSTGWLLIGTSTYATNIGAPMFVGLAGSAAGTGIAVVMFEWHALWMLLLLGWFFLPVYLASGCYTMPQYLKLRYGGQRIRVYLAIIHTILTILNFLSGQIYAGALFISIVFQWDLYLSVGFILLITSVYTIIGGLTAVMWTDAIQTIILVIGSIILAIIGLQEIGGYESMRNQFYEAASSHTFLQESLHGNHTCGFPPENSFHIFRPADDPTYPWPGMIFGLTILAINAWCTDQMCVQRSLAAKNLVHAKAGAILAGYLKLLPFLFFVIPGMISRVLFPESVGCADPETCEKICRIAAGCTNVAYPYLVNYMLPTGLRGLMMAALLAALMSSLTSTFNSSSTLFTLDLWRRCRPLAREGELMVVGRLWTVVLAVLAILWLPILENIMGTSLWDYSQAIVSFLVPPIVCVFVVGIIWPRATEQGAFSSLAVGLCIGVIRMGLEWSRPPPPCGSPEVSDAFTVVAEVHYLHFAIILFTCSLIVHLCVSVVTQPRQPEKLHRVTWWTRKSTELPELSEESEFEPGDDSDEELTPEEMERRSKSCKYFTLKWLCGVDKTQPKAKKASREEMVEIQLKATDIEEDPYWKRVLDINAVVACCICFFMHAYFY